MNLITFWYLFQVCVLLWYGAELLAFPWKGPSLCQLTVWRSFWRCSDLTYHKQCTVPSTEDHPHLHNIYILWRYLSNSGPSMSNQKASISVTRQFWTWVFVTSTESKAIIRKDNGYSQCEKNSLIQKATQKIPSPRHCFECNWVQS